VISIKEGLTEANTRKRKHQSMSRDLRPASLPRCALVWLAATTAVAALAWWVLPDLRAGCASIASSGLADQAFDQVLVWLCEAALMAAGTWVWVVTGLIAHDAAHGATRTRRGVPAGVRRAVLIACGAALVGGLAAPTYAAPSESHHDRGATVLTGLPLPDRATAAMHVGRVVVRQLAAADRPAPRSPAAHTVVVRPGDTLWGLADESLPTGASSSAISERWYRIYRANRSVIGDDPDLIVPSQRLRLPSMGTHPDEH
jgi:hypothetical protein